MCQLHFLYRTDKKKVTDENIDDFYRIMCLGSVENEDAWGIFNGTYAYKAEGIFNPRNIKQKELKKKSFILGHNRYSTSGFGGISPPLPFVSNKKSKSNSFEEEIDIYAEDETQETGYGTEGVENHHPFVLGDFMLAHNGIIYNNPALRRRFKVKSPIRTDSYIILWLIDKYFKESDKSSREQKIIHAVQQTAKLINGSYSVILQDTKTDEVYYFKGWGTDFNVALYNNVLIGTTSPVNLGFVCFKEDNARIFDISANILYRLSPSNKEPIKAIAKFEEAEIAEIPNKNPFAGKDKLPVFPTILWLAPMLLLKIAFYPLFRVFDWLMNWDADTPKGGTSSYTLLRMPFKGIEMKGGGSRSGL